MAAVTICHDFGAPKNKVWHSFHCFPISQEVMEPDEMIFVFWMLSFKPTFSLSSFTFIKRLLSSSSVSAIRVVSSAYRRRQWHPTPVFLPGESHGRRSLIGCSPWGCYESDMTEWLHFHFSLSCIGEEMATHSSVLAWRIPGTGEPVGLPSMGSHRVGHDWSDLAAAVAAAVNIKGRK